ncbi:aluminum-activated malate transporter 14-like [Humulus lupulus]|uniref:aluminum-activated malate transporter 14-like n=1 Tax=Humulus lupulus TaxID=3486 RepID=UPI002B4120B3|nr:aluminum-activated malate transporter 14-like [Humulus lupulus]
MIPTKVHAVTGAKVVENEDSRENRGKGKKSMKNLIKKMDRYPGLVWRAAVKMGKEDPRKVTHSLKVGLALTLVSLLYLLEPLFAGIGDNAIWAVMTVVVVLESTAGATLCKGLNRGFGTFIAGSLAFFIEFIANESGRVFRAVFIGTSVFLIGAITTYMRFFPNIKKNFDYGVMIFLLTFNLIAVSSYRIDNVLKIAHERLYTIAIGCGICLLMTLLVFPHWSGENLHNSTVSKLESLAKSIDACVNEYFDETEETYDDSNEDPIYEGFKAVLDSKSNDETMALHASWEPRHSRHCYRCPWQQYVKLGAALRQFGYTVAALHGCLRTQIQTPRPIRVLLKDPCIRLSAEVSKVLKELGNSIRNRSHCSPEILTDNLNKALQDLNTAITTQPRFGSTNMKKPNDGLEQQQQQQMPQKFFSGVLSLSKREQLQTSKDQLDDTDQSNKLSKQMSKITITSLEFSEALPLAAFASLLAEAVAKLDLVITEVEELGKQACFREFVKNGGGDHETITVTCETPIMEVDQNHLPPHRTE